MIDYNFMGPATNAASKAASAATQTVALAKMFRSAKGAACTDTTVRSVSSAAKLHTMLLGIGTRTGRTSHRFKACAASGGTGTPRVHQQQLLGVTSWTQHRDLTDYPTISTTWPRGGSASQADESRASGTTAPRII